MKPIPLHKIVFLLLSLVLLGGCTVAPPQQPIVRSAVSWDAAVTAYDQVTSRSELLHAIDLLQAFVAHNPTHYESRARLANAYTLLGAGYAESMAEKEDAYDRAMQVAEQAMMTSHDYAAVRQASGGFADAVAVLGADYIEAMEFWKTALFYSFREAQGPIDKLLRYPRLKKAVVVMERIDSLDREAIAGSNLMSKGIYYLALPQFAGGDRLKSLHYLAEAAAVSEYSILPRWGRAKYYAVAMQDYALFVSDLEWVASRPADKLLGFKPWNVLLQREAKALLESREGFPAAG